MVSMLLNEMQVFSVLKELFQYYFIKTDGSDISNSQNSQLNLEEIVLLEQLLWFSANVISDSDASRVEALS
jgi:hypothetical protein